METITELARLDYPAVFIAVFTILTGIKSIGSVVEWILEKSGLETKWMRRKRKEHELLLQTSRHLFTLQAQHEKDMQESRQHDEALDRDIRHLTTMFLDKELDDWRWEILTFSSALSNGRNYNRESFDHIFKIYTKYEKVLEENGMENGLVEESIAFIKDNYREQLEHGL